MSEAGPMVGVIITLCAIILAGRALASRGVRSQKMIGLAGLWIAIILLGMVLASLWLTHRPQ